MDVLQPNIRFDISAASRFLPGSAPITNLEILQNFPRTADKSLGFLNKFAEKIGEEFGFHTRYWCHKPWEPLDNSRELTSESLAIQALEKLLTDHRPSNIQAYLLGSTTNKRFTGSQAAAVLGKLGIKAPAYDLKTGCSTSLSSLHLGYALMALGYKNVLVSCAETLSKVIAPDNEKTWIGLADGAAALLLEQTTNGAFSIKKSVFSTNGLYVDAFTTLGVFPPTHQQIDNPGYHLRGDEVLLKELAYERYTEMIRVLLPSPQDRKDITWVIPHQVNRKLIDDILVENQLSHANILWDADTIGNIGGASILYTLARAVEEQRFDKPGKILMMSVGGGLSYAAQVLQYHQV